MKPSTMDLLSKCLILECDYKLVRGTSSVSGILCNSHIMMQDCVKHFHPWQESDSFVRGATAARGSTFLRAGLISAPSHYTID